MATLTGAGLRVGKEIRNSPGQVRSVISHLDQLIASGDFNNVSSLATDGPPYQLAESAPGSLLAVGSTQLAVSGPNGTFLLNLKNESRLTSSGSNAILCVHRVACSSLLFRDRWSVLLDGFRLFINEEHEATVQFSSKI